METLKLHMGVSGAGGEGHWAYTRRRPNLINRRGLQNVQPIWLTSGTSLLHYFTTRVNKWKAIDPYKILRLCWALTLFLTQHFALSENLVLYTSPTFTHLSWEILKSEPNSKWSIWRCDLRAKKKHWEGCSLWRTISVHNCYQQCYGFFVNVPYPHNENECSSLIPGK